jgi:hypothetical protein
MTGTAEAAEEPVPEVIMVVLVVQDQVVMVQQVQ